MLKVLRLFRSMPGVNYTWQTYMIWYDILHCNERCMFHSPPLGYPLASRPINPINPQVRGATGGIMAKISFQGKVKICKAHWKPLAGPACCFLLGGRICFVEKKTWTFGKKTPLWVKMSLCFGGILVGIPSGIEASYWYPEKVVHIVWGPTWYPNL